jgi:hypothetical protein
VPIIVVGVPSPVTHQPRVKTVFLVLFFVFVFLFLGLLMTWWFAAMYEPSVNLPPGPVLPILYLAMIVASTEVGAWVYKEEF